MANRSIAFSSPPTATTTATTTPAATTTDDPEHSRVDHKRKNI